MTAADPNPSRATPAAPAGGAAKRTRCLPIYFRSEQQHILAMEARGLREGVDFVIHDPGPAPEGVRRVTPQPTPAPAPDPASHRTVAPDLGGSSGGTASPDITAERETAELERGLASELLTRLRGPSGFYAPYFNDVERVTLLTALERMSAPAAPAAGGVAGVPTVDILALRVRTAVEGECGGLAIGYKESLEIAAYALTGLPPGPERDAVLARLAGPSAGAGKSSRDAGRVDAGAVREAARAPVTLAEAQQAIADGGHPVPAYLTGAGDEDTLGRLIERLERAIWNSSWALIVGDDNEDEEKSRNGRRQDLVDYVRKIGAGLDRGAGGESGPWETLDTCPSKGESVWVWGGQWTEPERAAADGDYWRRERKAGWKAPPTHWCHDRAPAPPRFGQRGGGDGER